MFGAQVCALGAAVPGQRPSQLDQIRLILTGVLASLPSILLFFNLKVD